jgi:hypothetical protein
MDSATLAKSLGLGFATGISTMGFATIVSLPASYIMNKFIYHSPLMRLMLGLATGFLSVFAIVIIALMIFLGKWSPVHYFGLVPMYKVSENPIEPTGYLSFLFKLFYMIIHPITMFYTTDSDKQGYIRSVEPLLVSKDAETALMHLPINGVDTEIEVRRGAVSEEFSKLTRQAGAIVSKDDWVRFMKTLQDSGVGKFVFTPSAE